MIWLYLIKTLCYNIKNIKKEQRYGIFSKKSYK